MFIATVLPDQPTLGNLLNYQTIGLAVVLVALAALALACAALGLAFKTLDRKAEKDAKATPPAPGGAPALDPAHAAIIAAVVSTLIDQPHRIIGARKLATSGDWTRFMLSTWAVEGRSAIFSSHKVR